MQRGRESRGRQRESDISLHSRNRTVPSKHGIFEKKFQASSNVNAIYPTCITFEKNKFRFM